MSQEKYPELGARYRHHYMAHQQRHQPVRRRLADAGALKARHHVLAVATGKSRAVWTKP
jgi:phosphoglycolate phosphatase